MQIVKQLFNTRVLLMGAGLVLLLVVVFSGSAAAASSENLASTVGQVRQGIGATGGEAVAEGQAEGRITTTVGNAINLISWVVGIISVIMIILGGLKYIMSSGDSSKIDSAKNTILYAVIGLVIVALAQIIVLFVLDRTTPAPPVEEEEETRSSLLIAVVDQDVKKIYN